MKYRRADVAGGTYFFTVNLADRCSTLLVDHVIDLRASVAGVMSRHPFQIDAWVVLPDHLHAIWTLPEGDHGFAVRWGLIKANLSRAVERTECISDSRARKGERGIWQRRFWEHLIRDEADFENQINYVHINPVKHGHVARAVDWQWSSIHRSIRDGHVTSDWACDPGSVVVQGDR